MRKRGRKNKDVVDDSLDFERRATKRGFAHVTVPKHASADDVTLAVLARELEILKARDFMEIREAPSSTNNIEEDCVSGSPVCTRLLLPQMSVMNCLTNSTKQVSFATGYQTRNFAFTPECHVLMSKACELFITEIASRVFLDATRDRGLTTLSSDNLRISTKSAWRVPVDDGQSNSAPFDFLQDMFTEADGGNDSLEKLVRIHNSGYPSFHHPILLYKFSEILWTKKLHNPGTNSTLVLYLC